MKSLKFLISSWVIHSDFNKTKSFTYIYC